MLPSGVARASDRRSQRGWERADSAGCERRQRVLQVPALPGRSFSACVTNLSGAESPWRERVPSWLMSTLGDVRRRETAAAELTDGCGDEAPVARAPLVDSARLVDRTTDSGRPEAILLRRLRAAGRSWRLRGRGARRIGRSARHREPDRSSRRGRPARPGIFPERSIEMPCSREYDLTVKD